MRCTTAEIHLREGGDKYSHSLNCCSIYFLNLEKKVKDTVGIIGEINLFKCCLWLFCFAFQDCHTV